MNIWLARVTNLFCIVAGYLISRISKKAVHWGNPVAVSIEPNNTCNLRCPECPAGMKELTRPRGLMEPGLFRSIVDQLSPRLSWITLYFQGEPYMSRYFFDFVTYARSRKIYVATSTNGHFLDRDTVGKTIDSGLNRLIISLDGADPAGYEVYRQGGDFNRVIAGIRLLVSEKKRLKKQDPEIVLQCLVLKSNEHQLDAVRKLSKELGVDKLEFKTAQFNDFEYGNPLMPENPRHSRYVKSTPGIMQNAECKLQNAKSGDRYEPKNRMPNSCFRMWSSCVITWDGKVVPCCFDKDAVNVMGDLATHSFREIWRGRRYDDFRRTILKNRRSTEICRNCSQTF